MEINYHLPDAFRYSLNSFIRAVADVPKLLTKNLEKHKSARLYMKPQLTALKTNELFSVLKLRRNFIVHQGMLAVQSKGAIHNLEGNTVKLSFPFPVETWESSDDAYERYKEVCRKDKFWRGTRPDCDSSPAIMRIWLIPQFPNRDLLEVAFDAWTLVGQILSDAVIALGGEKLDLSMSCRHEPALVRIKRYSQREFFLSADGADLVKEEHKWHAEKARRNEDSRQDAFPPTK